MEEVAEAQINKHVYSVWGIPPDDVRERLKKLMIGLRSEFGGPEFEPHVTVVGAISLTEDDARQKFKAACEGLKAYGATVEKVATGTFFYQCVFLLLHPSSEVMEASKHCTGHLVTRTQHVLCIQCGSSASYGRILKSGAFCNRASLSGGHSHRARTLIIAFSFPICQEGGDKLKKFNAYMPHLSLLYGDLTDEEKKKAREKADLLDESISSLSFQINRLALYKTETEDKSLKSWEKIAECNLDSN